MLGVGAGLIALGTAKFGRKCPQCKSRLLVTQRIIKKATRLTGGVAVKAYHCRRCGYRDEKTHNTPRLGRNQTLWGGPMSGSGGFGGSSRGGGFGGFGGGRSGGGGARGRF